MGDDDEPPFEPTRGLDIAVAALISVGGAAMILGNLVILWNRGYRPIKAKSVPLTCLSSAGGVLWILAALVVNGHFARKEGSVLALCALWTYWLQACFGFSLWLNCLTLRLITLYRIFICKRDGRGIYKLLGLLLAPAIGFCIAASVRKGITFKTEDGSVKGDCKFTKGTLWEYGLITLLVIYFLIFFGFAFELRKIVSPLNEYRLIRRGGIFSLFLFLLSMVTLKTHTYLKPVGRCLLTSAVASAIFYYFWARNGFVVYQVLFHKEEYLSKFIAELRRSPSDHERNTSSFGVSEMEDQLTKVRAEVREYRNLIETLEAELKVLEQNSILMASEDPSKVLL